MRKNCMTCVMPMTAITGLLLSSSAFADAGKRMEPKTPAPEGWYFLDEDVWFMVPDTTPRHFQQASLELLRKETAEAANEIRKGAAFVHFAARRETNVETKEQLQEAVLNLERLAANVEQRVSFARIQARHAFAKADAALARHQVEAAEEARRKDDLVALGYRLQKAAIGLESGYEWSGAKIEPRITDDISDALALASALQEGSHRDGKSIQASVEAVSRDVTALKKITDAFEPITGRKHEFRSAPALPTPDGFVLVENDLWFPAFDEPGQRFHQAQADYSSEHYTSAARELREAAAYVHIEQRRTKDTTAKEALASAVLDLGNLAKEMASGEHIGSRRVSQVFARTHYELARAQQAAARAAWEKKQTGRAGYELRAAMTNLAGGLEWSGHEFEAKVVAAAEGVETCCEKLIKDSGWVEDEVGTAIDFVGDQIDKLGKDLG